MAVEQKLSTHQQSGTGAGTEPQLLIDWCTRCALWWHQPGGDCPQCGADLIVRPVSGLGTVFTHTTNFHPYNPAVPVPYVIAIVELIEQAGLRVVANIVDCEPDSVRCGMPVQFRHAHPDAAPGAAPTFTPR